MSEPDKGDPSVDHIIPGILIEAEGLSIISTEGLSIILQSNKGFIELTQRQVMMFIRFSNYLIHRDWS